MNWAEIVDFGSSSDIFLIYHFHGESVLFAISPDWVS